MRGGGRWQRLGDFSLPSRLSHRRTNGQMMCSHKLNADRLSGRCSDPICRYLAALSSHCFLRSGAHPSPSTSLKRMPSTDRHSSSCWPALAERPRGTPSPSHIQLLLGSPTCSAAGPGVLCAPRRKIGPTQPVSFQRLPNC